VVVRLKFPQSCREIHYSQSLGCASQSKELPVLAYERAVRHVGRRAL